ncbi:unnamed protein product [Prorocentrum cordatum]|uniref:non-specific serine/threonine protein kinase n=1 Tax=Prorocentrum cordatum TaxID=2364126 RepID=A0ABN9UHM5_9DINO|nr:unnamed protein product [Polarella glacialis]
MLQALSQPISGAPADVSSDSFAVDDPAARELVDHGLPRHQDLFVGLLDFSRHGDAGPLPHEGAGYPQPVASDERARAMRCPGAADDGRYYLILEIAMETMEDFLERRTASRQPLRLAEVRQTFRELCEVVTGLHGRGLVHLDLKPANLMRFPSGRFKLIDMDGVQPCGRTVPVTDITCTAQYCSPEVAGALLRVDEDAELTISRLMDVYSLGLVGAELAAGEHPLEDLWTHHCGNSGATEDEDEREFYRSIVDPDFEVQLPPAIRGASPELEELLRSMLRTRGRVSMPEVMAHPFWHGPAEPAAPSPRAAPGGEAAR